MTRWVVITSDLLRTSGQGMANLALVEHLLREGRQVELVSHTCEPDVHHSPGLSWHAVPRPLGSRFLGERLLARRGLGVARAARGARVVVNGGNCAWSDACWVHMVHHAWSPPLTGVPAAARVRLELARQVDRRRERRLLPRARILLANSERTRADLLRLPGVDPARIQVIYLGIDPVRFSAVTPAERATARARWGLGDGEPLVLFVGGVGHDGRKGLDHLLAAWPHVRARAPRARLFVAGGGALDAARALVERAGISSSVQLLGDVARVEELLAAGDLLVSPTRHDSYGMNVQEALARGVPALVSHEAGAAERLPPELGALVCPAPGEEPPAAFAARILAALALDAGQRRAMDRLSGALRGRTWEIMAGEVERAIEAAPVHAHA